MVTYSPGQVPGNPTRHFMANVAWQLQEAVGPDERSPTHAPSRHKTQISSPAFRNHNNGIFEIRAVWFGTKPVPCVYRRIYTEREQCRIVQDGSAGASPHGLFSLVVTESTWDSSLLGGKKPPWTGGLWADITETTAQCTDNWQPMEDTSANQHVSLNSMSISEPLYVCMYVYMYISI